MPLQNRVDPFGNLVATPARGTLMGNRGLLHNPQQQIVRPFALKAWITCLLHYKNMYRKVMQPGLYTELFFLDEATAFAAGHRPCAFCRRADFDRFRKAWLDVNGADHRLDEKSKITAIDAVLHAERMDERRQKRRYPARLDQLPDGVLVTIPDTPQVARLLSRGRLLEWTAEGYLEPVPVKARSGQDALLLTPPSIVKVFAAGKYTPEIHLSAQF